MSKKALLLHPNDNCIVALMQISKGDQVEYAGGVVTAQDDIDLGHKMARVPIECAAKVYKYGASIGSTTQFVSPGAHIHTHNLSSDYIAGFHH